MDAKKDYTALRDKIFEGVKKAITKLIEETAKKDGELVISRDGKVIRVKARDLMKHPHGF